MYKYIQYIILIGTITCTFSYNSVEASLTTPFRACTDLTTNQQGCWELNESSGNAIDSTANGNDLTDNNTVAASTDNYWAETSDGSRDFESGNSEYFALTDASQTGLDLTGSYTITTWIKLESVGITSTIVGKTNNTTGYVLKVNSSNQIESVNETQSATSTATLSAGKWYHIAAIHDATNNFRILYINGNIDSVTGSMTTDATDTAHTFHVGSRGATATDFFDGLIKDVSIYSDIKTPEEIKSLALGLDLANDALRPDDSSLTTPSVYWKLNEISSGGSAIMRSDSIGSNDLTDSGTVGTSGGYIEGAGAKITSGNTLTATSNSAWDFGTGNFTIAGWLKSRLDNQRHGFMETGAYASGQGVAIDYNSGSGVWKVTINGGAEDLTSSATLINTDSWMHWAVKRTGTTLAIFVDGVNVGSTTNSEDIAVGNLTIGTWAAGAATVDLSDIAIWAGTALSDTEIQQLSSGLPIQQSGIVSYFKLDETSGTRSDSIGSNDLTDNNTVTSAIGQVGNAADFEDSNSEYLSITDGSQTGLDITDDISVLTWAKPETVASDDYMIDKNGDATGSQLRIANTNKATFSLGGSISQSTTALTTGTFFHISGVFTGAERQLWLNSALEDNDSTTTSGSDNANPFHLGANYSASFFYDGLLDEVIIAKRYFRDEEVKVCYNKGLVGSECTSSSAAGGAGPSRNRLICVD